MEAIRFKLILVISVLEVISFSGIDCGNNFEHVEKKSNSSKAYVVKSIQVKLLFL